MTYEILAGDALAMLRTLPDASVHCCVTSPPYWGLRSYCEDAVRLDPLLSDQEKQWVLRELEKRGINAKV